MTDDETAPHEPVTPATLSRRPLPEIGGGKENKGRLLVVGGARQTPGAVLLATQAALRVGAGKVQLATAAPNASALACALPEAYVEGLPVHESGDLDPSAAGLVREMADGVDVVLLGPGLGDPEVTAALLSQVVPHLDCTVVVDALATAHLTGDLGALRHLDGRAVLTPNLGELAATLQADEDQVQDDPAAAVDRLARESGAVVVSGAVPTYVVRWPSARWRVDLSPAGLGTAGSGDVKAGAVAGLLARGADPEQAAVWGVHLHARAGARLTRGGAVGFTARELADELRPALAEQPTSTPDGGD
ncbi:NAD(P)H-hydrate dehydratase [Terracoccus luteus]|uniref:ADP-dependent (S)-NAD(P)H-hydrate dehydratase n=1 Tax=Terracoccus luteus TaxID=53356 RepID=A0A839PXT3_9MICO|nr:NAD(P)H-hydrate dehydratase [Terracoccus luteus]MBB2986796.1 hydroxyethylthiazole kinase-like uncharacterized protein yjeF [Terracoccus luteus]MCP2172447.1 hydroxyethylthiazole kinase-like uncharacterized protein yjeF [Terracoccus luteus]